MEFANLLLESVGAVAIITVNRPEKLNALNHATFTDLLNVFEHLNHREDIRAVVITGNGEKAFVAGADITELSKLTPTEAKLFSEFGQSVFNVIENFSKPVIAAVNGFALGGGCELALACHFRYASEKAKFGQPEINLAIIPGYGATQRLARLINSGRAMEYMLTGDLIDSKEALRLGIVNKVFKVEELLAETIKTAEKISFKSALAVKYAIKAVNCSNQSFLKDGLAIEASLFSVASGTNDFKEGTTAFLEKRQPSFTHK